MISEEEVFRGVDRDYELARARLRFDPAFRALEERAEAEARDTPHIWFARNTVALKVESEIPWPVRQDRFVSIEQRAADWTLNPMAVAQARLVAVVLKETGIARFVRWLARVLP